MKGKLPVVKVDTGSDEGRAVAERYRVGLLPTFIVLDSKGRVVYRKEGGRPDRDAIARLRLR